WATRLDSEPMPYTTRPVTSVEITTYAVHPAGSWYPTESARTPSATAANSGHRSRPGNASSNDPARKPPIDPHGLGTHNSGRTVAASCARRLTARTHAGHPRPSYRLYAMCTPACTATQTANAATATGPMGM